MEDSLKGISGLGLDLLVLLDRPTAETNVSRFYNGSSTFKFIFTHMKVQDISSLWATVICTCIQGPRLIGSLTNGFQGCPGNPHVATGRGKKHIQVFMARRGLPLLTFLW